MQKRLSQTLCRYFRAAEKTKIGDLIHAHGDPQQALLCFRLFWPEFCVVGGQVFLKDSVEANGGSDRVEEILSKSSENPSRALRLFRSVQLPYIFIETFNVQEDYELLGQMLVETWAAALEKRFPNLRFQVRILDEVEAGSLGVGFEQLPFPGRERAQSAEAAGA